MTTPSSESLTIEGSAIQALMIKAILEAWSPEQRNALISDAISTLLQTSHSTTYGRDKTILEVALSKGAEDAAVKVVEELLVSPEFSGNLIGLCREELNKLFDEDPERLDHPIRRAISTGLRKELTSARY